MKKTTFLTLLVIMTFGFLLTGCQQHDDTVSKNDEPTYEQILKLGVEKHLVDNIGVPYLIRDQIKKGDQLPITIGSSPVTYYLPKDHPEYDRLYDLFMSEDIVFYDITYLDKSIADLGYPILDVKIIDDSLQKQLKDRFLESTKSLDEIKSETQQAKAAPTIISLSQATSFFNAMKNRSCGLAPNSPSDCIPFQYAKDGCYVRAHYMRLKFQQMFGGDCEKIFAVQSTSAWLKATTTIPCCQNWSWHMAPLVKVTTSSGLKNYVIDPGLFNAPVTEATWIAKLRGCTSSTIPMPLSQIKPGNTYKYNPSTNFFETSTAGYSTDRLWLANQPAGCIAN
ncbi:protein-glutamine glutaminase family protein [Chryseobacterium limigenitum]|uniref:Protein glutaminase domain-containing protein n=1 Tax=Chryseobacterium limigenitum TaxID=1612149 RepID=A0A1K2IYQ8_9FLAO|nr:protein-glutamine glutaminase family protein [Chryseobacterium limigenitum]SFZ96923.1 hypothetical protein SAMN05216324_13017 [Chryseobacterium limigenitum]